MTLVIDYCCDIMRHSIEESHTVQLEINDYAEPDFFMIIMVESQRKNNRDKIEVTEDGKQLPTQMGHSFRTEYISISHCPFCGRSLK
jgi:hypothetical protein